MVQLTHSPGRIVGRQDNTDLAELRYDVLDDQTWSVTSTFVDPSLRGQGVAGQLMDELVRVAADADIALTATCSYAVKWLSEHPVVKQPGDAAL